MSKSLIIMISSYRLGDLVLLGNLSMQEKYQILTEHPNSFGSKYIIKKKAEDDNIKIITEIVLEYLEQNVNLTLMPDDIAESTLIHLRLGDVIGGNQWHEKMKRPLGVDCLKLLLANYDNKKYVIGKCFFAWCSSTNYEECNNLSNIYLQNVINELEAVHINSENADIDLCCAIKSKIFVQGRGFFSKLIVDIRKRIDINSINIETRAQDD